MNKIEELIDVLENRHARTRAWIAKAQQRCIICQQPATEFRSLRAELEYNLSSICQSCQDYYIYDGRPQNKFTAPSQSNRKRRD